MERIDNTVDELKQKHGNSYTVVQYRVWAETMEAGHHDSLDKPPQGSFFKAQGRKSAGKPVTPEKASTTTSSSLTPVHIH